MSKATTSSSRVRAVLLVADQGLNSLTNVVVTLAVARSVPLHEFGVFATVALTVTVVQGVSMAAVGDRWLQHPASDRPRHFAAGLAFYRRGLGIAAGTAVAAGLLGAAWVVLLGLLAAVTMSGLDYVRVVLMASGRPRQALAYDAAFGGLQIGGIVAWAVLSAPGSATGAWLVWALAALPVFVAVVWAPHRVQQPVRRRDVPAARTAVSLRYGGEMALLLICAQVAQLIVSARIGTDFNGVFRAVQIPFGPLVVLVAAARALLVPAFGRRDPRAARRLLIACVGGFTVVTVLLTVATYVVTAGARLRGLLGGVHPGAAFVLSTGALYVATVAYFLCYFHGRGTRRDRAVTVSRVVLIAGIAAAAAVTWFLADPVVFMLGTAAGWAAGSVAMLVAHRDPDATANSPETTGQVLS